MGFWIGFCIEFKAKFVFGLRLGRDCFNLSMLGDWWLGMRGFGIWDIRHVVNFVRIEGSLECVCGIQALWSFSPSS